MTVKLNHNGYIKKYNDGSNTSVVGDYTQDEEVQEWIANGGVVDPFETPSEIALREKNEANAAAKADLEKIDLESVRSLREWVASQPGAPQFILDKENEAQAARARLQP